VQFDHRYDTNAIVKSYDYELNHNNQRRLRNTTNRCHICAYLSDGTSDWLPLKYLKSSNHIENA